MNTPLVSKLARMMGKSLAGITAAFGTLLFFPALSVALDLGSPTSRTPYDAYLGPMRSVFSRLGGGQPDAAQVAQWVREGRAFRYNFKKDQPYMPQTPEETEASRSGDCKAKSLWLASKMNTRSVRYVIGKANQGSNMSHAWILWQAPDGWTILDATLLSRPLDADRVSRSDYLPIYSYSPSAKYAHTLASAGAGAKYGDHL